MLQEPLLVVGAFYILFFTVIIYVRLDFAITKVWQMMIVCFLSGSSSRFIQLLSVLTGP